MSAVQTQQASDIAVDLRGVAKVYRGGIHALRSVDLQVRKGEVFGLLGPNGAGKSTLVKIMMTVVRPTIAAGTILGEPIGTQSVLARVGYLPEHHRFPQYLTGRQVIDFFGALCKVPRAVRRPRVEEVLDVVGMREWGNKRVTQYSKGMQQRIGIAVALVNDPQLVVLDEPTDGVDPVGRRDIRDVLIRLRGEGRSVLVNSHLLGEVEMVAERVAILNRGETVLTGTIEELTRDSHRYEVVALGGPASIRLASMQVHGAPDGTAEVGRLRYTIPTIDHDVLQQVIDALRAERATIVQVQRARETLEELFVRSVVDERGAYTPGAKLPGPTAAPPPASAPAPPTTAPGGGAS
ncbi:MAG: ABC transporter ATP-binding protein [Phycisphaerae bacterium]|nr:ABC transporter ATP-binding protein [Phycisphaerae bacterium]